MKPDWKDAPEWAQFLAQEDNGKWYWYEKKPAQSYGYWIVESGRIQDALKGLKNWNETLEPRP